MSFDKTQAMRNAERFLAQGKIGSAIGEYKQIVAHDPKDFGTLNLLGDLHFKNSEKAAAVKCYNAVAEHFSKQGFAQKAIAIYNKISRIEPNSVDISARLAELYKQKGSVLEARSHYVKLAEHYQSKGRKTEALEVWKQIALVDPNNTEVYLTIAQTYLEENDRDAAVEAFSNAGSRFIKKGLHDRAIETLEIALDINPFNIEALSTFVECKLAQGQASEAADRIASLHETEPLNRDVLQLLVACYVEAGEIVNAEKAVIRLVEMEPSNYPQLLEIALVYLKSGDTDSAARILTMSSEHLLVGGQSDEFRDVVNSILEQNPEQLQALRLLARYCSWQRDEAAFRESLERLARQAGAAESVDDERFALSQLAMIAPHEAKFTERLHEINEKYGYDAEEVEESLFDKNFVRTPAAEPELETFASLISDAADQDGESPADQIYSADFAFVDDSDGEEASEAEFSHLMPEEAGELEESGEGKLEREIDSIKFYIENGYLDLAAKAIADLRSEFGNLEEIRQLSQLLETFSDVDIDEAEAVEESYPKSETTFAESPADIATAKAFVLDDLRAEFGIEDSDSLDDGDFETHYHTAVAYQEMGLLEDAIKEFQDAIALANPNDGTRRFFQCSNLIGHCFMQKAMPNLAVTWFQRSLETNGLTDDEKQGIWYELAAAYEAEGDMENAGRYFEQVYAENIDFRDVGERMKNIVYQH